MTWDSVSPEFFYAVNWDRLTFTPSRDCTVVAVCFAGGAWPYDGGTATLSIDCPELEAAHKQVSRVEGGNTVGRDMRSVCVFEGARRGVEYTLRRAATGSIQGTGDKRLFCVCL